MSEELPHLDVLESVHAAYGAEPDYKSVRRGIILIHALYIALLLLIAHSVYYEITRRNLHDPIELMARTLIGPVILVSWFFVAPGRYFYFETSPEGLLARGFSARRFIPWIEVESTTLFGDKYGGWITDKIITNNMELRIPKYSGNWQMMMLQSSMRQHLRELNKVDDYLLPRPARLLWKDNSTAVEKNIDWTCPRPSAVWKIIAVLFLVPVLILGIISIAKNGMRVVSALVDFLSILAIIYLLIDLLMNPLKRAQRVRVHKDGIEADIRLESVAFKWSDIKIANWGNAFADITQQNYLIIGSDKRNTVMLPYSEDFKEAKDALLAIINRLNIEEHPELLGAPDSLFS